jgi:type VI protein secretion system component VasK
MGTQLIGLASLSPWNLMILLLLAVAVAVIGITVFRHVMRKSEVSTIAHEPKLKKSIRRGFFMKERRLPWIVMLGAKGAGKNTLVQSLDRNECVHIQDTDEDFKRPLDGVVLTLPASELIGKTALSRNDIIMRAEALRDKLKNLQHVPIYILITKCDLIPGFESFCKAIPQHNKHDILGWSNEASPDARYTPDWMDTAFASINQFLSTAQEEIYVGGPMEEHEGVFIFSHALNQLRGGIRTYVDHLFKTSSDHPPFFLRGLYFVGTNHGEGRRGSLYFIDDLFERKIFQEGGRAALVIPSNTRFLQGMKVAAAAAIIMGTLGLLRANERLQEAKQALIPLLTHAQRTPFLFEPLSSVFIPVSWFDPLDEKIRDVLRQSIAMERNDIAAQLTSLSQKMTVSVMDITELKHHLEQQKTQIHELAAHLPPIHHLMHLQKNLQEQYTRLLNMASVNDDTQLSQFFNARLAGRFPFVEDPHNNSPDAHPEDIRAFFEMLDTQKSKYLAPQVRSFIEQMQKVRDFLGGPESAFAFTIDFRVNREEEAHANEILEWEVVTQDTPLSMRSMPPLGYWAVGDPLQVTFRWALNSPFQPTDVEGNPNVEVKDHTVIFCYEGMWPLLRLLRQHQVFLRKEEPITLRFEIPLTNVLTHTNRDRAVVFVRFRLTSAKGTTVDLPFFPFHAPCLIQN